VYPRRYYSYPYHGYGYDRYRSYGTPYRFRGADGLTTGYRDRRYDLRRSINTVYNPPISTVREPAVATPARRVIDGPGADLPSGTAQRRLVNDAKRVQGGPVEARRARPEEPSRERSAGEPRLIRREVEGRPAREVDPRPARDDRAREAPRSADRAPAREARPPQRQAEPARSAPADRGGGRGEGRSSGGGSREGGGSRPSNEGGRRHR
jgi:hypothetical protein